MTREWPDIAEHVDVHSPGDEIDLSSASFVVVRRRRLVQADFAAMPKLRLVSCWGVGFDHVDTAAAGRLGIPVVVNPVFETSVAEAGITLVLALYKRLPELTALAKSGTGAMDADADAIRGREVRGQTMGIVGFGRIGRAIGQLAHALGMLVVVADPALTSDDLPSWCTPLTLDELVSRADVVVLAAPLTDTTSHLIDRDQLARMPKGSFVVNVGRGGLIDEAALLEALLSGHIGGAGLDVWEQEPVDPAHPLLQLSNVVGTPHALARTRESYDRICAAIAANIQLLLEGRPPLHVVNSNREGPR